MADVVTWQVVDRVALVTIDRPRVRNAMDWDVFTGLEAAATRATEDDAVGAVVVAGAGGTFSAGLDVSLFGQLGDDGLDADHIGRLQQAFNVFEDLGKPTVAAIRGHCLGAGAQLAAACHLRLVADDARIAIAERRWALVPDLGGTWRLPRLVGLGRATDWVMTGRTVRVDEAVASGFAQGRMVGEGIEDALALAADLATAPGATRRVARLLRDNLDRPRHEALRAEAAAQLECLAGPDVAEAVAAAAESRAPEFIGR
jgi:enoyl-CoA hydratase/carnithine racemase